MTKAEVDELYAKHREAQNAHIAEHTTFEQRVKWLGSTLLALHQSGIDIHSRREAQERERMAKFWLDKRVHALADVWKFTLVRLNESHLDLNDEQLQWRAHENAHTIAEILFHIAGCEHYWASRLLGRDPRQGELESKLDQAARDGFLRDAPCPFPLSEHRREEVDRALAFSQAEMASVIENPNKEQLEMRLISPIGNDVNGYEGLCRLAQHAGYHTGQIWVYRMDPRFPI